MIFFYKKKDFISYDILKKKNNLDFKVNLIIDKNPIFIDFLSYKKKPTLKAEASLTGSHKNNDKTIIKSFSYNEGKNQIKAYQILLNENLRINSLKEIDLKYFDQDFRENQIKIVKKKSNKYEIIGFKFNANSLINSLIEDNSNNLKIFDKDFDFKVKIDQVFLDKEHLVNNLKGNLNFKNNQIRNAELNAFFLKIKNLH